MIVQRGVDFGGSTTHFREVLLTHKLNGMKVANSEETINDVVLQIVGRLGERLMLKRAVTMTTNEDCVIGAYTHGPFTFDVNGCRMGKYAALVALQPRSDVDAETLRSLATRLSQHIVGMNPSCMSVQDAGEGKNIDKADILLEQNYLMDESMTVGQFLERNGVSVVDFLRMECGDQ